MQWSDEAIILGIRRHGESSVIAEVMTPGHGRHLGLVRSGRSRTMQPVLQPGNSVEVSWRARLDEHLGEFRVEPLQLRAASLIETATSVYGIQALGALLRLLPERDPHPHLYEALAVIVDHLQDPADAGELFVRFELAVLNDLGFGLDLSRCGATGARSELVYVSPKSGRAICREAGAPTPIACSPFRISFPEEAELPITKASPLPSVSPPISSTAMFTSHGASTPRRPVTGSFMRR